ncbi:bifunctional phosphopantothenoylcysteine decarboxylase/phosphopantothenate--cysteine ligase CoaBC [Glutamicibacter protophormiae]|uniref:bifunctional phosphopantothenoylcysteine decarboxylase/phosphopantothenate--cysteine ligase CoaBC n=1 Tax=Glutamicibacter protophormiae TaxID=37930 RepID=UPI002A7FA8EF|nr:bifunctional phosphopantothenoylcysteine decarboxylase/phosphopantothenate--cysteine ligase CoaBC [Glutamicibacter protophormiae]WPR66415.1 bifunctional phosphopantothenoylcysteine decarboxylase/phosphopantothenate--cysteine ligase CoaBC [Glutamicibacter protophormiae]WPR69911.1 bifunctional phosphopantothenoylcysteine decarboxylase/phosphopantothenate--cysteine ligase CoaBC [Glutamicibacter protophormiae]
MKRIVLGVSAGIAAYKSVLLLRLLREAGHHVDVIPTGNVANFVGNATWEALSGNPVTSNVFDAVDTVNHVRLGQQADLVLVVPATADIMARAASGLADDLLTGTLLATRAPVVMAPAMHTEMWQHPATVANTAVLRERGVRVIEPASGRLTGKDTGPGRLPEPEEIFESIQDLLSEPTLAGRKVLITAGGTREPLDPVRFLGNRSSGRQGVALAQAARDAGAQVTLIATHLEVPAPHGVALVHASSALELREAVFAHAEGQDALIMNAAVADFRPASIEGSKIKKRDEHSAPVIELVRNPDILAEVVSARGANDRLPPVVVGFAAETGDEQGTVLDYGKAKLARKGCELLVVNEVGANLTFGTDSNTIQVLFADGKPAVSAAGSKIEVARVVIEQLAAEINGHTADAK